MELVDHERPAGRAPTVATPNFTCGRPSARCRTSETRWIIDEGGVPIGDSWVYPTDLIAIGQQAAEEAALPAAG